MKFEASGIINFVYVTSLLFWRKWLFIIIIIFKCHQVPHNSLHKRQKYCDMGERHLGDYNIQNFHLGRYIVGYTVGNLVLRRRVSGAVKRDFRTYIRGYTSPNENFEYSYPHTNALLTFSFQKDSENVLCCAYTPSGCQLHKTACQLHNLLVNQ